MSLWLLPVLGVWPLVLAALVRWRALWWLPAVGALPALGAVFVVPLGSRLELPWLLLGTTLGLDGTARVFLLFSAILWTAAGVYAAFSERRQAHGRRFGTLFLLAMAGNFWLIVGQDLVSFYLGFAVMGLSSYGLVIHAGDAPALRAGKVYLVMALLGEVMLFAALVLIAGHTGTLLPRLDQLALLDDLTIALTVLGLGVKSGMVPLHLWLPLAHPAAPIPASAVLSGAMIKVAILGWLRFLPFGAAAFADWGLVLTLIGLATMCLALPVGMLQSDPKVILAYSSIAKMGLVILLLGVILADPSLAPIGIAAITLYVGHHALVKGGLFLGVGLRKFARVGQPLVLGGLIVLALAMAGAPLTSGALAKHGIEPLLASAQWPWIGTAVGVSAIATTLLMARFLWVTTHVARHPEGGYTLPVAAWVALLALVVLFPFVLGSPEDWLTAPTALLSALAVAAGVLALARARPNWPGILIDRVPPGDLLVVLVPLGRGARWVGSGIWSAWCAGLARLGVVLSRVRAAVFDRPPDDPETVLRQWPVAGSLWLGISALLLLAVIVGGPFPKDAGVALDAQSLSDSQGAPSPEAPGAGMEESALPEPSSTVAAASLEASAPALERPADVLVARSSAGDAPVDDAGAMREEAEAVERPQRPCDPEVPFVLEDPFQRDPALVLQHCTRDRRGVTRVVEAPELTNPLVLRVQGYLSELGFDPGPRDGLIGPKTRRAIRAFQASESMPSTGAIDFDLLEAFQAGRNRESRDFSATPLSPRGARDQ